MLSPKRLRQDESRLAAPHEGLETRGSEAYVPRVVRSSGARLAVLLSVVTMTTGGSSPAIAGEGCVETPAGLECTFEGVTTTVVVTTRPPLRYVRTTGMAGVGTCWYWSRYPPGFDYQNPAHANLIQVTRTLFPECPSVPGEVTVSVVERAWQIFREFELARPTPRLRPVIGIANLPSLLTVSRPDAISHSETLPDGRLLEVVATVATVRVDWADGTVEWHPAAEMFAGGGSHPYRLKTCPPKDRPGTAPAGPCHPTLEDYPVRVTFVWTARYRAGGAWADVGTIERSRVIHHDVDEVIGVQVRG